MASLNIKLDIKKCVNREESAAFQRTHLILEPHSKYSLFLHFFTYTTLCIYLIKSLSICTNKLSKNFRIHSVELKLIYETMVLLLTWQEMTEQGIKLTAAMRRKALFPSLSQYSWSCGFTPSKVPPLALVLIQLTRSQESCLLFCWMIYEGIQ